MRSDFAGGLRARRRTRLLAGASLSALTVGVAAPGLIPAAQAATPRPLSQAWFAAHVDASTAAAATAAQNTIVQVSAASRNLATLATRLQQMQTAQTAAAMAARVAGASATVPNGLTPGGLAVAPGTVAGSALWLGAQLPTQASSSGRSEVTVTQTAPQAALTWQSFNVGATTDLTFDQHLGGALASNWVVVNRLDDAAISPTTVLGSIKAAGKVFVINANGIIFGAGSQVNVGSLIASTAAISDAQLATGIYGAQSGSGFLPSFTGAAAPITVALGATIATNAPAAIASGGGYAMLLGSAVDNEGDIETPEGQTILAAGQDFILRAGYSTTANQTATVVGSQIATTGKTGSATNGGLIEATHGDVTLAAPAVVQDGVIVATTSVNARGTVHLLNDAAAGSGSVTLGPDCATSVNPDDGATTALDSQRTSLIVQSAANDALRATAANATNPLLGDVGTLPDRLDEGRIEIVTGGAASFQGGSVTMSQGGQIAVQAAGRSWIGDGAELDVSGSSAAVLPMSSNVLSISVQGNELRDAPVNRDTGLITSTTVNVDARTLVTLAAGTGGDPNARAYTAGGLLEVSGYLSNVGHTIDEWAAPGGMVTLAGAEVVTQPGAELNVAGGAVTVQGGSVPQSYLIGADGQLYNVNTAPANVPYVGVYGGLTATYPRWGITDHFGGSVGVPLAVTEAGYAYGRDAGSVVVNAPSAVLEGRIDAGVSNGVRQTAARPAAFTDSYALPQSAIALPGTLALGGITPAGTLLSPNVTISDSLAPVAETIGMDTKLPDGLAGTANLAAAQLSAESLGGLSVLTGGKIDVESPLILAPGGSLTLTGADVTVAANLTARGGRIALGDVTTLNGAAMVLTPNQTAGTIAILNSATLDLRGQFTNAPLDPAHVSGEGLVNGGALVVDAAQNLDVAAGTVIDAGSGGAVLPGGKTRGGMGGNVTLIGADPLYGAPSSAVVIAPTLADFGVGGGGTLTLTAPMIDVAQTGFAAPKNIVVLPSALFMTGFSDYLVDGFNGLDVLPGAVVTVAEPVLSFQPIGPIDPAGAPTGTAPDQALTLILPPTYAEDRATGRLTQRQGASVAFIANNRPGTIDLGGGAIDIGAGSAIAVDPGRSVRIEAFGQITDDGAITAPGGAVAIVNERSALLPAGNTLPQLAKLSVWIGGTASIDVAGIATTAADSFGRPYGTVLGGGSIVVGGPGGVDANGVAVETDATVLIRQGATLDASGAAATIDLSAGSAAPLDLAGGAVATDPVLVASAGGSITLGSFDGIVIDGTLRAAAGGVGAAGGTLTLVLESPSFGQSAAVPEPLQQPRLLTITQEAPSAPFDPTLMPGDAVPHQVFGTASISAQLVEDGGFGSLSLYARDAFQFAGDVTLTLPQNVSLNEGLLADTLKAATVSIAAPYVQLSGETAIGGEGYTPTINGANWHAYQFDTTATLSVAADLIDVSNTVRFGVSAQVTTPAGATEPGQMFSLPGFAEVTLDSTGDLRFGTGSLTTPGDLNLVAAQLYPVTGAVMSVFAGFDQYKNGGANKNIFLPDGTISVSTGGAAIPSVPYSVGGRLALYAGNLVQDGVIRAPEGTLTLGGVGVGPAGVAESPTYFTTDTVELAPGSLTSVSLDGATVPYGGTVDGVTYTYNGAPVGSFTPAISLQGLVQTVQAGATLDLAGGGTLAGAGFVTGRGGSTDVLTTPLLQFNAGTGAVSTAGFAQAPVYAIDPSFSADYAPGTPAGSQAAAAGTAPAVGSRLTLGDGIPGIPAGTYTLLPASYALLPGAARVQIDLGVRDPTADVVALGAGSYELNAATSVANTAVAAAVPVQVIVTTGAGIIQNAQYNQETYSQFELAQAANYSTPRTNLPEDGKQLNLIYPAQAADVTALNFSGTALFQAAPGGIGRAGQADVEGDLGGTNLEITADGAAPTKGFTSIEASALDALGAPRLVIGGRLTQDPSQPSLLDFIGNVSAVTVGGGAVLHAPEIFLVTESLAGAGAITVAPGAVLNTVGAGTPPIDSGAGVFYNVDGTTLVALSNGNLVFADSTAQPAGQGAITVADGAALLTEGTLNFATSGNLSLGSGASYGASYLTLSLGTINLVGQGAAADPTPVLPSGFVLTQPVLNTLLAGNPATGTPALQSLILTASQSINFAGNVSLDTIDPSTGLSTLANLTLNTPAIYGFGSPGVSATIATGTLYWNGTRTSSTVGTTKTFGSALPGGVVADGPGTGSGTLDVVAQNIVLGYGPNTAPDDQTTLNRVIAGFATVNLTASEAITGADRGTLSVYQTAGAAPGEAGSGGDLNLITPLLTGAAGSVDGIVAGGALTLAGTPSTATAGALGAEIDLTADSISANSTILLNAGRLSMSTLGAGGIAIGPEARLDLAGRTVTLVDQAESAGGGALVLNAAQGGIVAAAGSMIDVSASGAAAGSIAATAINGAVDFAGTLGGGGGAGQNSGGFTLRAGTLADFTGLNAALDAGALYGSRDFEIAGGDLTIAANTTITAHQVDIAVDGGRLTVAGTIEAGGATPGAIALSAGGDLTLADGAVLDAAGTLPQHDSTGAPIEAENRATVALASGGSPGATGRLTLGAATIDVSAPVATPLGLVSFTAPQLTDANGQYTDVAFSLGGAGLVTIRGAQTVALYGSRTYQATDANGTIEQHDDPGIAGSVGLDGISADNAAFLTNAAANAAFTSRIAPLITAAGTAWHFRPADVIESGNATGQLTVDGDLDLSTLRYGAGANATPGAGEVGMLTLRAASTLTVNGSITDGFAAPDPALKTPDNTGWVLYSQDPLGQAVTLPQTLADPITVKNGSTFSTATPVALNYGISIAQATLKANVVIPTDVVTAITTKIPFGGLTATADITGPDGAAIAVRGQVLAGGTVIPKGSTLSQGTVLPFTVSVADHTFWPKGATLSVFASAQVTLDVPPVTKKSGVKQAGVLELHGGAYIPAGSTLKFDKGAPSVDVRTTDHASQGLIYATAAMLPAGAQSWSINLVGGANLASADVLAVQPRSALAAATPGSVDPSGSIVLSDNHYTEPKHAANATASFSVVRTGTGSLNLVAAGNVDEASLFGVYTAGTNTSLGANDSAYQTPRATLADGTVLGAANVKYNAVDAGYQAWYPDHGGDVLVAAQGEVLGDILGGTSTTVGSDNVGDWLWRQGGTGIGQATAWSINFGSYVLPLSQGGTSLGATQPRLAGFTGIGALGGGNVTVIAGADAGEVTIVPSPITPISQGLVIAVASTGRVTSVDSVGGAVTGGTTDLTGGGLLTLDVGGTLNPAPQSPSGPFDGSGGSLTDMRGDTAVTAGQIGRIDLQYDNINSTDPRPQDPFTTPFAVSTNGVIVVPGDGGVRIATNRDLVLAGAGDPGREPEQSLTAIDPADRPSKGKTAFAGDTGFSLWTAATAIDLFANGGNLTPTTGAVSGLTSFAVNDAPTDYRFVYPGTLNAAAASGSFYYGASGNADNLGAPYSLELAPAANGQLSFIAAVSIYANGYAVDMSGANATLDGLPNPFNPAYTDFAGNLGAKGVVTNFLATAGHDPSPDALFAFEADTPTTNLHANDPQPAMFYAATGDVLDLQFGEVLIYPTAANTADWYLAAKPARIVAGRDIISSGTRPSAYPALSLAAGTFTSFPNETATGPGSAVSAGNLLLNDRATDISLVSAGRDILSSYFYIAGPGLLEVDAGRNIDQTGNANLDFGVLRSIGPVVDASAADRTSGAGIAVLTGLGSSTAGTTAFADLYLNDANQADLSIPLDDPRNVGKVQQTYQAALYGWLQTYVGYAGSEADAPQAFALLPPLDQAVFVRLVFFDELLASGRQHSDQASLFFGSYARGRTAITTLFPSQDAAGDSIVYAGNLTMDSGTLKGIDTTATVPTPAVFDAGISTLLGGSVQILSPGGADILGTAGGAIPGASSGVLTFGSGDIDIYALGSVLLGQSRIFTTFGGNILIWSAQGDINAGRGAKTTTVQQPSLISYDAFGGVTQAPSAPTSGAGIATLAPIAGTTPGDVDLIAPLGTVDAGEAGIRVSGNLNIAALTVLNAANVQVGGKTTGNTAVVAVNSAAAAAASSVAGSSVSSAVNAAATPRRVQAAQTPSVITVQVLNADAGSDEQYRRRRRPAA